MGTSYVHDSQITFPKKKHGIHLEEKTLKSRAVPMELNLILLETSEIIFRNRFPKRLPPRVAGSSIKSNEYVRIRLITQSLSRCQALLVED